MDSNELDAIAKEVHMSYYSKGKFGKDREEIKEICQRTGVDEETARQAIEKIKHPYGTGKNYRGPVPKKRCPKCRSEKFHAFVEEEVIREGIVETQTSINLNPFKPFTIFNHRPKVIRKPITKQVSKFVCDNCGEIF